MPQFDEFHKYEVVDRAERFVDHFQQDICDHPVVKADPELRKLADEVCEAMVGFYQKAAIKFV